MFVMKLPFLVDLQQKAGEVPLSLSSCSITLENTLN
jgi:hypothetical protein